MVNISILDSNYELYGYICKEDLNTEHKEFFLTKSLSLNDIKDILNNITSNKLERYLYDSTVYYIEKYYDRYLVSLTNISKKFLHKLDKQTHSKFYIGVDDDGYINGIPIPENKIDELKTYIESNILKHYEDIIGLHTSKGSEEIFIDNIKYYDFDKIKKILLKHTKINIHKLKNGFKETNKCTILLQKINETIEEEEEYQKKKKEHQKLMTTKKDYNDKFSQGFHKLIRSEVMDDFMEYTTIEDNEFKNLIKFLCLKIIDHNDVEKYLKNGLYIPNSFFSKENPDLDTKYGNYMTIFLAEYKVFKQEKLKENIQIGRFKPKKNPLRQLNPLLKNITCFNKYLNMPKCLIEIEFPIIKDTNVFIASTKFNQLKILERILHEDIPCTSSL